MDGSIQSSRACVECSSSVSASRVRVSHARQRCSPSPQGSGIQCDPGVTLIPAQVESGQIHIQGSHTEQGSPTSRSSTWLASRLSRPRSLRTATRGAGKTPGLGAPPSPLPGSALAYSSSREQALVLGCVYIHVCACVCARVIIWTLLWPLST